MLLTLLLAAASIAQSPPASVSTFRTEAEPRVDPVFGDVLSLRASVDRFLLLQTEMEGVRNDFSTAVHETLALLPTTRYVPTGSKTARAPGRTCPTGVDSSYGRALGAGARYLQLGRQLEAAFRAIRRADDFGDAQGLTPDYRVKVKKARELYAQLLREYREMRVAFYDQLGGELRFAGCPVGAPAVGTAKAALLTGAATGPTDPANPASWELDAVPEDPAAVAPPEKVPPRVATGKAAEAPDVDSPPVARAIWIDVDNANCAQPSRVEIDGTPVGEVAAGIKTSVRTRAGPREVCLLPKSDKRTCGDPGTLRRTYFYEGLRLTVHCPK